MAQGNYMCTCQYAGNLPYSERAVRDKKELPHREQLWQLVGVLKKLCHTKVSWKFPSNHGSRISGHEK